MRKIHLKSSFIWNAVLVLAVFLSAFIVPVLPPSWGRAPVRITFTLIFLAGALSLERRRFSVILLSMTAFVMEWVSMIFDWPMVGDVSKGINIIFFFFVILSLMRQMATAKVVTTKVILESISGYLMLGIIYAVVISGIVERDPAAFNFPLPENGLRDQISNLSRSMYFGFVTLATLGFGDLVPLKPYSRSLTTFITVSGQLYIAIIISMLVGKYASRKGGEEN